MIVLEYLVYRPVIDKSALGFNHHHTKIVARTFCRWIPEGWLLGVRVFRDAGITLTTFSFTVMTEVDDSIPSSSDQFFCHHTVFQYVRHYLIG